MKWWKIVLVIVIAVSITALGIDAADTLSGKNGTLLSQLAGGTENGRCPPGMVPIENHQSLSCVDAYEASPKSTCPHQNPEQVLATQKNIESKECDPVSEAQRMPWRFVTRDQAMQLCAKAGKRLPTNEEWYTVSLGLTDPENTCNVASRQISETGAYAACVAPHGTFDLVGNAWEWVRDDVVHGTYNTVTVPDSGYVAQVDTTGMAVAVAEAPQELFGKDYFWSKRDGAYGIIRGGYYDSGADAGVYTTHAGTVPTTASAGIGFRCVK